VLLASIEPIKFVVNDEIKETIKQAEVNAKKMIDNVDSCLIHFNEYGSNWLKSGTRTFYSHRMRKDTRSRLGPCIIFNTLAPPFHYSQVLS